MGDLLADKDEKGKLLPPGNLIGQVSGVSGSAAPKTSSRLFQRLVGAGLTNKKGGQDGAAGGARPLTEFLLGCGLSQD
jgi:hypothetical protein